MNCANCKEGFCSDRRVPKYFNCGHTFCSTCLEVLYQSKNVFCPQCLSPVAYTSVEEVPTNYAVLENIESLEANPEKAREWMKYLEAQGEQEFGAKKSSGMQMEDSKVKQGEVVCREHNKHIQYYCSCGLIGCLDCCKSHEGHHKELIYKIEKKRICLLSRENVEGLMQQWSETIEGTLSILSNQEGICQAVAEKAQRTILMAEGYSNEKLQTTRMIEERMKYYYNQARKSTFEQAAKLQEKASVLESRILKMAHISKDFPDEAEELSSDKQPYLFIALQHLKYHARLLVEAQEGKAKLLNATCPSFEISSAFRGKLSNSVGLDPRALPNYRSVSVENAQPMIHEGAQVDSVSFLPDKDFSVAWDSREVYFVQGSLMWRFNFFINAFVSKGTLKIAEDAQEYSELVKSELVATGTDGCLYMLGGYDQLNKIESASCFQIQNGRVQRMPSLSRPKMCVAGIYVEGYVYAFGGSSVSKGEIYDEIEKYNCFLKTWRVLSITLRIPRSSCRAVRFADDLILISGGSNKEQDCVSGVEIFGFSAGPETISLCEAPLAHSAKAAQLNAYVHKGLLYTISGSYAEEDRKHKAIQYTLRKYSHALKLESEIKLPTKRAGLCEKIPEWKGVTYEFQYSHTKKGKQANAVKAKMLTLEGQRPESLKISKLSRNLYEVSQ